MDTKRSTWECTFYIPNTVIVGAGKHEESEPHSVQTCLLV